MYMRKSGSRLYARTCGPSWYKPNTRELKHVACYSAYDPGLREQKVIKSAKPANNEERSISHQSADVLIRFVDLRAKATRVYL